MPEHNRPHSPTGSALTSPFNTPCTTQQNRVGHGSNLLAYLESRPSCIVLRPAEPPLHVAPDTVQELKNDQINWASGVKCAQTYSRSQPRAVHENHYK